jgi:glycosyltransferase involved in cell wall biosynthesis
MPTVSVVTPTYNRADRISRAIESVLAQTYEDWEHLIVDDASTDDTRSVVENYDDDRIRYFRHETNRRQAAARNTAIEAADGEFVAFIDSDDEWRPTKLEKQVVWIEDRDEEWVGVYTDGTTLRSSRVKAALASLFPYEIRKEGSEELVRDILTMRGNISAGSSLLARTSTVRAIDGFDESLPRHEDLDFTLRLLEEGKLGYIDEELFVVHESSDPSADVMAESKRQYLANHADTINELEAQGYPVRRYHDFHLARCFFTGGRFREGWRYLRGSKASNPRQYLRLGAALFQGLKTTASQ